MPVEVLLEDSKLEWAIIEEVKIIILKSLNIIFLELNLKNLRNPKAGFGYKQNFDMRKDPIIVRQCDGDAR